MATANQTSSIRSGQKSKKNGGRIFGLLFGFAFFGMGALICWTMGLSPLLQSLNSKDWEPTPCVIVSSKVETHNSSDGTTYSIDIRFRYNVEGKRYVSETYNFDSSSSSGRAGKTEVIRQYPKKSKHSCWVNPEDPKQAVLNRDIPGIVFIIIPFSSIFILIGLSAFAGTFGLLPKKWKINFNNRHERVSSEAAGAQTLSPSTSGIGKVIGILFAACFWNGIVSVFVTVAVKSHLEGHPEWFLTIFIIPFVLIGIFLILAFIHSLLALANPRLELTLSESRPRLGDSVEIEWMTNKPLLRVKRLRILLVGQEAATYRRGTDTVTDHSTFYNESILDLDKPATQKRGKLQLNIPIESMHTFDSGNNKIEWQIKVLGDISRYPDIKDSYTITIRPAGKYLEPQS